MPISPGTRVGIYVRSEIGRMGIRRALLFLPLAISLGWLCLDAPGPFLREAYCE